MVVLTQIISAIAWPLAAVVIACLFRHEVRGLSGRISSLKLSKLEAQFERGVEEAKEKVARLPSKEKVEWDRGKLEAISTTYETFQRIAEISPRAAIVEYWLDLEAAIAAAAEKAELNSSGPYDPRRFVRELIDLGHIESSAMPAFEQLREVRNQAAHLPDFNLSVSDAHSYLASVLRLGNEFRWYAVGGA